MYTFEYTRKFSCSNDIKFWARLTERILILGFEIIVHFVSKFYWLKLKKVTNVQQTENCLW